VSGASPEEARKGNEGYNVATGQNEDLVKAGVVDPTKVTRSACKTQRRSVACCSRPKQSLPKLLRRRKRPED
jgi:chaperonin GroEL (HSP60 family)